MWPHSLHYLCSVWAAEGIRGRVITVHKLQTSMDNWFSPTINWAYTQLEETYSSDHQSGSIKVEHSSRSTVSPGSDYNGLGDEIFTQEGMNIINTVLIMFIILTFIESNII